MEGAIVGYDDFGLTSGSVCGGASGGAGAGATAVLIVIEYITVESQIFSATAGGVPAYPTPEDETDRNFVEDSA